MLPIRKTKIFILLSVFSLLSILKFKSSHDQITTLTGELHSTDQKTTLNIINRKTATYEFNNNISLSVYLNRYLKNYQAGKSSNKLPFHWYDWVDLSVLNNFINLPKNQKFDCQLACSTNIDARSLKKIEEIFRDKKQQDLPALTRKRKNARSRGRCLNYCRDDQSDFQPGFRVYRNLFKGSTVVKYYQARSFLYSESANPYHLVIVSSNGNLPIPLQSNSKLRDHSEMNMLRSNLYQDFINDGQNADVSYHFNQVLKSVDLQNEAAIDLNKNFRIPLDQERFLFDGPNYLKTFPSNPSIQQKQFKKSLDASLHKKEAMLPKHFTEALLSRDSSSTKAHIDWRFFTGKNFNDVDKMEILEKMLRTWFKFTLNEGILSWLSHGGLLAHSFNGMLFPYDDDLDIQMPYQDLIKLAENFNNSLIIESFDNFKEGDTRRSFLLDVTDSISHRTKGNGLNNIDARLIDTATGFFIDITALAVSSAYVPTKFEAQVAQLDADVKFQDPNFVIEDLYDKMTDQDQKSLKESDVYLYRTLRRHQSYLRNPIKSATLERTPVERFDINYKLEVFNCRNNHFYELKHLNPLRLSYVNGIPVLIPNDVEKVLSEEYKPQYLLSTVFRDWVYLPQIRLWAHKMLLKDYYKNRDGKTLESFDKDDVFAGEDVNLLTQDDILAILKNKALLKLYVQSWEYTLLHEKERMIIKDEAVDSLLVEKLLTNRNFVPKYNFEEMDDVELYSLGKNQVNDEYSDLVAYSLLGRDKSYRITEESVDFNKIGWSMKDILELYSEEKYDPDIDLKIVHMQKEASTKQSEADKARYKEKVDILVEKKRRLSENSVGAKIPKLKDVVDYAGFDAEVSKAEEQKEKEELEAAHEEAEVDQPIEKKL